MIYNGKCLKDKIVLALTKLICYASIKQATARTIRNNVIMRRLRRSQEGIKV